MIFECHVMSVSIRSVRGDCSELVALSDLRG